MKPNIEYVGTTINGLKIISYRCTKGSSRRSFFTCICVCGETFESRADDIKKGAARSCGCKTSEFMSISHSLPEDIVAVNILYRRYFQTAKKRDILFSLTTDEFKQLIFKDCVYCGSPPRRVKICGSEKWNVKERFVSYNGIDRVDNNKEYVIDNCVSCCYICNGAKSDLSLEDFQIWINQLVSFVNGKNNGR